MSCIALGDSATGMSFGQQHLFERGLKIFGERGFKAGMKEVTQPHEREVFAPTLLSELTEEEKRKAQEVLLLLTEKRDESVKGRGCYNGAPTRAWIGKEDTSSPTVSTESIHLCAAIDACEGRDNMTGDVPNAFVQTSLPEAEVGERE